MRLLALALVCALLAGLASAQVAPVTLAPEFGEPLLGGRGEPNRVEVRFAYCAFEAAALAAAQPTRILLSIEDGLATISPAEVTVSPGAAEEDGCARSLAATVSVYAGWSATVRADARENLPLANATAEGDTPPMRPPVTQGNAWEERAALAGRSPGEARSRADASQPAPGEGQDADARAALLLAFAAAALVFASWRVARRRI